MLSINLIERLFAAGRYDRLLDALVANGLPLPPALRVRLAQAETAAVGLALIRVTELTYGPTRLSRAMVCRLLESQQADGAWDDDPLVTAVAVAALARLAREHARTGHDPSLRAAQERGLAALAARQDDRGLFPCPVDRTCEDQALTAGLILFLLAGHDDFRAAVRFADLMSWFEQEHGRLDDSTDRLWRYARLDVPAPARAVAASAA